MGSINDERKKKLDEERKKLFARLDEYSVSKNGGGSQEKTDGDDNSLKKIEYDLPSNEQIENLAKDSLFAERQSEESSLKEIAKLKAEAAKKAKESSAEQALLDKVKSDAYYSDAIKRMENQALKRGISRSSIAVGELAELENAKATSKKSIDDENRKVIARIDDEIATLESDLAKNLAAIDQKYAKAIDVKVKELKDERDKKLAEMIKYNNTVNEKLQQGAKGEKPAQNPVSPTADDLKKLSLVITYYNGFDSAEEALTDFLSDPKYYDYLGDYYVNVFKILTNRYNDSVK